MQTTVNTHSHAVTKRVLEIAREIRGENPIAEETYRRADAFDGLGWQRMARSRIRMARGKQEAGEKIITALLNEAAKLLEMPEVAAETGTKAREDVLERISEIVRSAKQN